MPFGMRLFVLLSVNFTMCAHLLDDGWKEPRCVQACFPGALRFEQLEENELSVLIESEGLEQLRPKRGTRPNIFYKNLYRFDKVFIAGSVALQDDGILDCVKGAKVTLYQNNTKISEAVTDAFGDFKFDQLSENSGSYSVEIETEKKSPQSLQVELGKSLNLGTIIV